MLAALWSVLQDLWGFLFGVTPPTAVTRETPAVNISSVVLPETSSRASVATQARGVDSVTGRTAYVIADSAECLARPVYAFDLLVGKVIYAQEVIVESMQGAFAHITTPEITGWVPVSALADEASLIWPQLDPGVVYSAQHEDTKKIRRLLRDELLGGVLYLPLQSTEYVLYKLQQQSRKIGWSTVRPRLPGSWHVLLRGTPGIAMSINPKTGSIIEVGAMATRPFLGYVEEVRPDLSIKISTIGRELEGEYRVEVLSQTQWKEWQPVFISIE